MGSLLTRTWDFWCSVRLTVLLLFLIVMDLWMGYFVLDTHKSYFVPLNQLGLLEWSRTYGVTHLSSTIWFFILLVLLAALGMNTFVCTTSKLLPLLRGYASFSGLYRFVFKLSPHIMHYAILIILSGFLVSYMTATVYPGKVLLPETPINLPDSSLSLVLTALDVEFYSGSRLSFLEGQAMEVNARIEFRDEKGRPLKAAALSVNRPVWFRGMSVHIKSFAPRSKTGMPQRDHVSVIIKRDRGMALYLAGTALFVLGLLMYFHEWIRKRQGTWK